MRFQHLPVVTLLLFCVAFFCGGCRKNSYDKQITASTQQELNQWLSLNAHRLSVADASEINACLNEIKISIMLSNEAKGQESVNRKLCEKINGMPLKHVIMLGYELQIARFEREKERLIQDFNYKEKLKTRPGDLESANFLDDQKKMVRDQIAQFDERINRSSKRLDELRRKFDEPSGEEPPLRLPLDFGAVLLRVSHHIP